MVMEKKKRKKVLSNVLKRKCLWEKMNQISVLLCMTLYCISWTKEWTVGSSWLDRPEIKVYHVLEVSCAMSPSVN